MKNEAKQLRQELKAVLPKFKFSITSEYNALRVVVLQGPTQFPTRENISQYRWNDQYEGEQKEVVSKLMQAINKIAPRKIISEDSDYGSIPNYYLNVSIGSWDKDYTVTA